VLNLTNLTYQTILLVPLCSYDSFRDGFVPWGVIQSVFKGAVFGLAQAVASSLLVPLADQGIIPMALAKTMAGGIGGGFQGLVLSPTLLLKTRVMTDPVFRERMSLWKTTLLSGKIGFKVVETEGVGALMKVRWLLWS